MLAFIRANPGPALAGIIAGAVSFPLAHLLAWLIQTGGRAL